MRSAPLAVEARKDARLRLGLRVFVVLIVLAIVEWYLMVARAPGLLWWLIAIQVVEAGLIVYYFMHVAQLWRPGQQDAPRH